MTIFVAEVGQLLTPGSISVPGLRVRDKVIWFDTNSIGVGDYENSITVDDQIQQLVGMGEPGPTTQMLFVRNPKTL